MPVLVGYDIVEDYHSVKWWNDVYSEFLADVDIVQILVLVVFFRPYLQKPRCADKLAVLGDKILTDTIRLVVYPSQGVGYMIYPHPVKDNWSYNLIERLLSVWCRAWFYQAAFSINYFPSLLQIPIRSVVWGSVIKVDAFVPCSKQDITNVIWKIIVKEIHTFPRHITACRLNPIVIG